MCIVILRAGDAIPEVAPKRGEFSRWIQETVGSVWDGEWLEHDVRRTDQALPHPQGAAAFVITGSSSSVTERAPWMLRTEEYIRGIHAARIPLLGICFGHQLIAQALGGEVLKNPRGREIGTVRVKRTSFGVGSLSALAALEADSAPPRCEGATRIFDGLDHEFFVNATHVDSVVRLPAGARVLASTDLEPHAAYALGDTTFGVQFHPEIDGEVMREYVKARAHLIEKEGLCHRTIHEGVTDAPEGSRVLANFISSFVKRRPSSPAI